jgi:hypothetical protein
VKQIYGGETQGGNICDGDRCATDANSGITPTHPTAGRQPVYSPGVTIEVYGEDVEWLRLGGFNEVGKWAIFQSAHLFAECFLAGACGRELALVPETGWRLC